MARFMTFTFVVRMDDDSNYLDQRVDLSMVEDPRPLLTDDEVMFWGAEPGVTIKAQELGADPDIWPEGE